MGKINVIISILISTVIVSAVIWYKNNSKYQCIKYHTEKYWYDATALAVATKNYGLLAMSGWRKRIICDERVINNHD